ncbi:ExeM/NucH family extracellular endonuclease [Agrococcus sp. HG114]|uniref:ExeM/NucH family extracellular endonuclease n=1 Tax=Agrococcus sp. HG114 TaxID=2969757 RepID=UPI00215A448B|nr:ExeM/NucH family extracellular endonuclease [Agrococcus sp. HG114]MCR8670929.1 ExeM/NucH family extracellular endonuclease [Agrococcus sp. HG114]
MRARTLLGTGTVAALALTGLVAAPANAAAQPVINEFSASTTGTDLEFIEVLAAPGTDLSGYSLLEIEGDASSPRGTVDGVWAVPALDASGRGLLSLASDSLENGTVSLLLVQGTIAAGADIDADDDGAIDAGVPFTLVDAVAVHDGGAGDVAYGGTVLGVAYDGQSFAPGGASRIPDGTDTGATGDWVRNDFDLAGIEGRTGSIAAGEAYNTPGAANAAFEVEEPPTGTTCESAAVAIGAVQGSGAATPLAGQTVTVRGTVVGDWQAGGFDGFHLQDAGDGDAATSDGIFVYAPGAAEVAEGDLVTVTGTAGEYQGQTQLSNASVLDCGDGALPAPIALELPIADEERFEGMLVQLPQALSILEYFNYGRYGEVVVGTERQMQPTAVAAPGSPEAAAIRAANAENRITIDDARSVQNADPAIHPGNLEEFTLANDFRGGDTITGITGVLEFRNSLWKLQPTAPGTYTEVNPRTPAPEIAGASLEVASFNVLNYFTTLDSRGAVTAEEFERQEAKIVAAIDELDSAIVGLLEIENNDGAALDTLVAALNEAAGPNVDGTAHWAGIDTGRLGTDEITTALIYQPALVAPVGEFAVLDSSVDPRFDTTKNRPALAQSFRDLATDRVLTVAVNHLKSKGSACEGDSGSPEQGNCNAVRTQAAAALADWLEGDPTGQGAEGSLIIGDLNAYDHEDPITTLEAAGYTDLLEEFQGEEAYTYVFDGQLGYLDYGLADAGLLPFVAGAAAWHANADETSLIDYSMQFKKDAQDALYAPDPYRASDHDAVVIGLAWEAVVPEPAVVEDYAGTDRYESNVAVSRALFAPGTDVIIASGAVFADALTAGPAAASAGASLLLSPQAALLPVTLDELERLQPGTVTIVGGTPSVSTAVVDQVMAAVPGAEVSRIAGSDRFETAALIADRYFGTAEHAFIASGEHFADAVSASGVAAAMGESPVLLTPNDRTSAFTSAALESLGATAATVLGSSATISDFTEARYETETGLDLTRVAGTDRYATNVALIRAFITPVERQPIVVAAGTNFPDALSASAVAGVHGAPVVLVQGTCSYPVTKGLITAFDPATVFNVGGEPTLRHDAWRTDCF